MSVCLPLCAVCVILPGSRGVCTYGVLLGGPCVLAGLCVACIHARVRVLVQVRRVDRKGDPAVQGLGFRV